MPQPGVHVATIRPPQEYTEQQLERAVYIAHLLDRGRLILTEPPQR